MTMPLAGLALTCVVQSPHVVAQSIGKLIRDRCVSDICAANLTATISDENVFRTNGKRGAIVDIASTIPQPVHPGTYTPVDIASQEDFGDRLTTRRNCATVSRDFSLL